MIESTIAEKPFLEDTPQDLDLTLRALLKAGLSNRIHVARDGAETIDFIFCEGARSAPKVEHRPRVIPLELKLPKILHAWKAE